MTVPLRIDLDLVSLAAARRFVTEPSRPGGYGDAVPRPAHLRVGAFVAAGLLIAAATPLAPSSVAAPVNIAGMIVFLDPGHSGVAPAARRVPDGRGATKDCEVADAATSDGYPEHTFAWDTTLRIRQALTALGVRSAMSRGNDTGPGPCVDERATMANALHPNAIVSIAADGGPATGRGFHILYSAPALNQAQQGPAVQFAAIMRDQLSGSGVPPANYTGTGGLQPSADQVGLNLAQYPAIQIDLGNMQNPADAGVITTTDGRQKYADAIVRGIAGFLATQAPAATPAPPPAQALQAPQTPAAQPSSPPPAT
jgi:N-acetylmuramoyl-L-alanine amidase